MENLKEMCTVRKPYKCAKCGQDMLFFKTRRNRFIDYKALFEECGDSSITFKEALMQSDITYLKCLCCNQDFLIDWTTGYPIQVIDKAIVNRFLRKAN